MTRNIFDEIRLKQHDEDYEPRREGLLARKAIRHR